MNSSRTDSTVMRLLTYAAVIAAPLFASAAGLAAEINPQLLNKMLDEGVADTVLVFAEQSQPLLTPLRTDADYLVRRRVLVDALRARAEKSQRETRAWLDANGISHQDFWIANVIQARIPRALARVLAVRPDIERAEPNVQIRSWLPQRSLKFSAASGVGEGIAWGVSKIEAPLVWAAGFTGQGIVIAGEDTGYLWTHPVLKPHYRGWNGISADHNYNWHDAIHDSTGNVCGNDAQAPCDDQGHGTHTAGTFVGDDGATAIPRHQTGVAPGARWIGCRNMDANNGTPARYIECMQWMLAPTKLNGSAPNSDLAPDVVNNSWYCPPAEGCTVGTELQNAVNNLVAGGIFYVAAAQNSGPLCDSIVGPPAVYDSSFDVGATNSNEALARFSSRGPVPGSSLIRPDLSAPGVAIPSSYNTGGYVLSDGTSMAAPHVVGAAALLMSAFPALKGHPAKVASILRATAVTQGVSDPESQVCGTTPATTWPNNMIGYGRVDAWNAYRSIIFIDDYDG